uniref:Centromere protein L n=1 Tax=Knipowitschia caucasica TaxID=637954 RepID=A0AAV2L9L0_KNICA
MEQKENRQSGERTPCSVALVQRRSKSYRQSYRSCLGATSRLFTPGHATRRLNSSRRAPRPRDIKEQLDPGVLSLLTRTEWQLSYVTPLFQFRHTRLKSYARQLSAFMAAERQQGVAVEVQGEEHTYRGRFSLLPGLVEGEGEAEAVLIQLWSRPAFSRADAAEKPVWSGWFSCVRGGDDYLRSLPPDFVGLPLFCSSGAESLTATVKAWFSRHFDCSFGALPLDQDTLQWVAALWANCHLEADLRHLTLLWEIPVSPPLKVSYAVEPLDAWTLWSGVRRAPSAVEEGVIGVGEVEEFVQELKRHFHRHFRLQLSAGNLTQVSSGLGAAKSSGRVKISSSRYLVSTLSLLTECALLKMPI